MVICQCDKYDGRESKGCRNTAYVDCYNMMPGNTIDLVTVRKGYIKGELVAMGETRITLDVTGIDDMISALEDAKKKLAGETL